MQQIRKLIDYTMKLPIIDMNNKKVGDRELPAQFGEAYRPDLILRAVHALHTQRRQPYGNHPDAGFRHSHHVSKRRRDWKTSYGFGISRVARKVLSHRGTRMFWVGTFSPQTVGGRRAHPPKAEKIWAEDINEKELRKALRSALAATVQKKIVSGRGHKLPEAYPFVLDGGAEKTTKTKAVANALRAWGFDAELARGAVKKVRAGKGKWRGRRYQKKKSVLLVTAQDCPLLKAARNIPGVDAVPVQKLNAELLAPGGMPGRVTLWTTSALSLLEKNKLFM